MPKFLYTILLITSLFWLWWFKILNTTTPDSTLQITKFLLIFTIAITLTLSIPTFFIIKRKKPTFTDLRMLYRKAIKLSLVIGLTITSYLILRFFEVATLLNTVLLLVFYAMILLQLIKKRN